ncbi:unnamed protein product [Cercospora beticola]|nr:unnamed protein product [Cercospora beticola]
MLASIFLLSLATIASAGNCIERGYGLLDCPNHTDRSYYWRCLPSARDPANKDGPPGNQCRFVSRDTDGTKYYCVCLVPCPIESQAKQYT